MKNNTVQHILAPVDFSVYSMKISQVACALAATHRADLTLLYVMDVSEFLLPENRLTPELLPEMVSAFEGSLEKQAQILTDTFDVHVHTQVVCGFLVGEVLEYVRHHRVDMIVSGIADHPTNATAASASTILRLASQTSCPVWGLVDKRYYSLSSKASLIRKKILLHQAVKNVKVHQVRSTPDLIIGKSRMAEVVVN